MLVLLLLLIQHFPSSGGHMFRRPKMNALMQLQAVRKAELHWAVGAPVGHLPRLKAEVGGEVALLGEGPAAAVAPVRPLAGVQAGVHLQAALVRERVAALGALVRPLVLVNGAHMQS